ncbi:MAG: hypothetical protein ABF242_02700 [Flavobacteriales bacterium]
MGSKILYYLVLLPISVLPHFILYGVSNVMFVVIYSIGYRKKVITSNIRGSFPSKSDKEIKKIVREFYRHFCDLVLESVKNFSISEKQVRKRVEFENLDVLDKLYDQDKNIISMTSHYCNWELLAVSLGGISKHQQFGIYKPLKDITFDVKMKKARQKLGLIMFPMADTIKYFKKVHSTPASVFFASDQWPSNPKRAYWTKFLNRESPILFGAEQYSHLFDWSVVYCEMTKVKRGYYKVTFRLIAENPSDFLKGEITNSYIEELEKTIRNKPSDWLWSHRRWKRTKEEVFND